MNKGAKNNKADGGTVGQIDGHLVVFGGTVKALGGGKYRAPLVRFSGEDDTDLAGDYFTKDTDFWREIAGEIPVIYHHGQDSVLKSRRLGLNGKAVLSLAQDGEDAGVWMEGQLNMADSYEAAIYGMIEAKKMGTSSGSAPHLVERVEGEKAAWIKSWPLVEASLTPTPCEPKSYGQVLPLKSLKATLLGTYGSWWWGETYFDEETDSFDPATDMTASAAARLNDRLCTAIGHIIRAKNLTNAQKVENLRGVVEEYTNILLRAAEALLVDDDGGDDAATEYLKAALGFRFRPASVKDAERLLRDVAGLTRQEAKTAVSTGFASLLPSGGAGQGQSAPTDTTNDDAARQVLLAESLRLDSKSLSLKTAAMGAIA